MTISSFCLFILTVCLACEKKIRTLDIKLLILTPDIYYGYPVILSGTVRSVGPGGLWFILEDSTGYIQVTTERMPEKIPCVEVGKKISFVGTLKFYDQHKYFSFSSIVRCEP
jgi:hypothetical protein